MNKLRTFYTLIITQMLSLIGSRTTAIAIGIWIFAETGNASPLLIVAFFAELPQVVGGIFAGWIADKFSRKYVIIISDVGQAIGTVILLLIINTDNFALWHLYLITLFQGFFAIMQEPATGAIVSVLVPENHRDRANGLREIGFNLAGIVAPALAGMLFAIAGLISVMIVDLITFVIAVGVVSLLTIPTPEQSEEGLEASQNWRTEMMGGLTFLWRRPALFWMVIYLAFVFFLINGPLTLHIPYLSTMTSSESLIGILLSVVSLGAFAGALTVTVIQNIEHRMRWILWSYMLHGIMFILYGITHNLWFVSVIIFLLMYPLPLAGALFNTILQTKTPADMQGRVFAITGQIFTLTTPLSFLLTAYLVDEILEPAITLQSWQIVAPFVGDETGSGMGLLLVIIGIIIIAVTGMMIAIPAIRHLEDNLPAYQVESANI